jgi:hypothetical protein
VQEEPTDLPEMSVAAVNYAVRACELQDAAARMVLVALSWQSRKETPHLAHMSNEDIRRNTGLKSINGVKDALRRLVNAGEIRVREIGGRTYGIGKAADFELLGVKRWIESGEPSESDSLEQEQPSEFDGKVSAFDGKPSESDGKPSASDTHRQRHSKTGRQSADAPAPATPSPSLPSSSPARPPRKKAPKVEVSLADLKLPHGPEFRAWWVRFMDYRSQPIKGRCNPLTKLAADLILEDLAEISESDAMKAIRDAITANWVKPYTDKYTRTAPAASKVVHFKARASDDSYEREIERRVGGIKA